MVHGFKTIFLCFEMSKIDINVHKNKSHIYILGVEKTDKTKNFVMFFSSCFIISWGSEYIFRQSITKNNFMCWCIFSPGLETPSLQFWVYIHELVKEYSLPSSHILQTSIFENAWLNYKLPFQSFQKWMKVKRCTIVKGPG